MLPQWRRFSAVSSSNDGRVAREDNGTDGRPRYFCFSAPFVCFRVGNPKCFPDIIAWGGGATIYCLKETPPKECFRLPQKKKNGPDTVPLIVPIRAALLLR